MLACTIPLIFNKVAYIISLIIYMLASTLYVITNSRDTQTSFTIGSTGKSRIRCSFGKLQIYLS
jgi:hypothetical protein